MTDRSRPVGIRRAARADAAEIVRLVDALNAFQQDPTGELAPAHIHEHAFGPDPLLHPVVADSGAGLVGVAIWERTFELAYAVRGAYLSAIWVEPGWRRRGIARAMLDLAACDVRAAGGCYIWWVSQAWNGDAHATYQRLRAIEKPVRAHALIYGEFEAAARRGRAPGLAGTVKKGSS